MQKLTILAKKSLLFIAFFSEYVMLQIANSSFQLLLSLYTFPVSAVRASEQAIKAVVGISGSVGGGAAASSRQVLKLGKSYIDGLS